MRDSNHRKDTGKGQAIESGAAPGFPILVQIAVRQGPISGIVASPDGTRLMVANYGRDSVSVIDTRACRVVQTVPGLDEPFALAVGRRDTNRAYVSTVTPAYDSIAVIDLPTNTVIARHPLALSVSDLAVSPDGNYVYASRDGAGGPDLVVLDIGTGRAEEIALPNRPGTTTECVRSSADGSRLYVATNGPGGGQLVVIDAHAPSRSRVLGTVEIGLPVRDVALSPNGAIAYVASCAPELGAVIDVVDTRTAKITGTSKISEVGGILTGLTLSRDGDRAYLVSDDGVTVLSTLTHDVVGTIGVANQPSCVVESVDARYLYIADYSGTVTVAPVASAVALGDEAGSRHEGQTAAEWAVPELLLAEPALA
ncbi:MAG TPA: YncE family protein [Mycobacteriales bacterium]|nr:YncE family protein [Mycobacteriales bacterium]